MIRSNCYNNSSIINSIKLLHVVRIMIKFVKLEISPSNAINFLLKDKYFTLLTSQTSQLTRVFLQPVTKHVVPSLSFLSSFSGSDIGNNLAPNCTGSLNCVSQKNIVNILMKYFLSNILFKMIFFCFLRT